MESRSINHCPAPKFPACFNSFKRLAPAITGTLKKKENSAVENNIKNILHLLYFFENNLKN